MPVYDCGYSECEECERAFGPDRRKAIENYKRRESYYATLSQNTSDAPEARRQAVCKAVEAEREAIAEDG